MEKRKKASRPHRLSSQEKADLRASLSNLLQQADYSAEAAQAALRACLKLRRRVPVALLTRENIASSLSLSEVASSLDHLSGSQVSVDISAALEAIRVLASKQLREPLGRRALLTTTKAVTLRLTKIATQPNRAKEGAKSRGNQNDSQVVFTEPTLSSATDLALWMLTSLFAPQSDSRPSAYPLAIRWMQAVEVIWRRCFFPGAARSAVRFLRSVRRVVPASVYAELKVESSIADFLYDANSALIQEAATSLLEGRLKDLESILALVTRDDDERNRLLSELRYICQSRPSELIPEAVEWVARQIEMGDIVVKSPIPADASQSSALDYVAVCLLSAWDAADEGSRSAQALESIKRLARELFKVDLTGTRGEIVIYDERQHELRSQVSPLPAQVQLIRPGVRWSDGVRTRFLVRAIVEPRN